MRNTAVAASYQETAGLLFTLYSFNRFSQLLAFDDLHILFTA